jgi:hypothetical protein
MLQSTAVIEAAKAEAATLARETQWMAAFTGAAPRTPVLVKNLTRPNRDYYIVDFQKNGKSTGRMLMDPDTAKVRMVTGIRKDGESLPLYLAPEEVTIPTTGEIILENGQRVAAPVGSFSKELVWKHSMETRTMFQPLYRLTWGNGLILYLRIDRKFYGELTPTEDTRPPAPPTQP